jgi:drug/metabolite transporter (DMT)-like permease
MIWLAVLLSFAGTWLLGGGTFSNFGVGDLLVAISAIFWALHVVIVSMFAGRGRPILFTCLQFAVVALIALGMAILFEPIQFSQIQAAAVEIAYVGLLSSALTFTLLTIALRATPPAEATIIVSTETVFAALGAYVFLGERLSLLGWQGALLILAAVVFVQLAGMRRSSRVETGGQ